MSLTPEQIDLYSRQIILRELGGVGQRRLLASRCLLRGSGLALATAATYLAGAGVGHLDFESPDEARPAFAPLATRNPDVVVSAAPAVPDLASYDVALDIGPGVPPTVRGRARIGEIAVHPRGTAVDVVLVPSDVGCLACVRGAGASGAAPPIDEAAAGALAALSTVLWLADIRRESEGRCLTLERGAPTWTETPLGPSARCPRPCRP